MPTRHRTNFTPKGEVKKCPIELHAKLRNPQCRVEQSEFEPHNRPKPSPSPGPGPGPGPLPPFVPGYNPKDGPTPVDPVGPFPPPPPPPPPTPPSGGGGFPYGPVIAGSVVGGIGAGLLARRALQQSMRAQIDPSPDQPAGSTEYQPVSTDGEDPVMEQSTQAELDTDITQELPADPATITPGTSGTPETLGEAGEGATEIGGGTTDVLGAGADIGSEASTAMTTTSLNAGFFSAEAEIAVPAAEEGALLAASGAAAEATADTAAIVAAADAVAAADTAADIAAAEAIAAAGPDEATFGVAGLVAAGVAAAAGAAAAGGIIIAYETAHKRPPTTTALTKQELTATISNLTGAVVKHPKLQSTLNAVASAQQDGRPVYNVYNGTKTVVVAQLSNKDLIKAQSSYNSNPNVFKGQDPNVLKAMGLNPNLSKGSITGNFYNSNVAKPPPVIPAPPAPSTPAPTTGSSSNQKPGTKPPATTPATTTKP